MPRFHPKYLVPNAFTALSMLFGLWSAAESARGHFTLAAWMILWGVLLDKLDGSAARLLKASSAFGVQYDSFADFVVFGVAPAALAWFKLCDSPQWAGALQPVLIAAVALYVVAVSGRLARFNISSPPGGDLVFYGIPTTLVGAALASLYLTCERGSLPVSLIDGFPIYLIVSAVAMVSSVRLPKLKLRKSKAMNVFQIGNVAAAYVLAPMRLWPELLLAQAAVYLVGGVSWALLHPPVEARAESGVNDEEPMTSAAG